ncbi:hypothetical protein CWE13_07415 [Aliidiomarina shirensis]|uniref:Uncharacterized protein n=1 Tax=Aliidiomarina shirensis TaxID=1048642 RepID=A0A432WVH1_9GAMM|nr:hypothetical protein [Aliidiomarina shirensis]RUO37765.1 hypothetical protein CWE13_07415 [Aliidiomarina shirensis]
MISNYEEADDYRPLIYLDQNVIDDLRKGKLSFEPSVFSKNYRAVYSDETLREISRAEEGGGNATGYLDVLEMLEAYHLKLQLNAQFAPTGSAIIQYHTPSEAYNSFTQQRDLDYLIEANLLISQKIMGGLPGLSVDDIAERMLEAFERNARSLEESITNIEPLFPEVREEFPFLFESFGAMKAVSPEEYKDILKQLVDSLKANLKLNDKSQSALSRYRDELRLSPKYLNNLEPSQVVEQIWQLVSRDERVTESGITMYQFFGVDATNPIYTERKNFISEQVSSVYFHLNLAGYYPDKGLEQRRKFATSFSDMQHASLATHCNYLLSSDERLIKKAAAAYEFTGARTQVLPLKLSSE